MTGRLRKLTPHRRSRATWGIGDQVVSSAGNFAVVLIAARTLSVDGFGAFAVAFAGYGFAMGLLRAIGGEVLLVRAVEKPREVHDQSRRLLGLAGVLGLGVAAMLALASVLVTPVLGGALRTMAIALPVLLVQDSLRHCFFAAGRPERAMLNDSVWTIVAVVLLAVVVLSDAEVSASLLILAWACGAVVAVAIGLVSAGLVPRAAQLRQWVSGDRGRVGSFLADFLLATGSFLLAVQLIGLISGLAAVAAIQGGQLLFAPFATVTAGARIFILPTLAEGAQRSVADLRGRVRTVALALYGIAAVWSGLVLLVPDRLGTAVLGATWVATEPLLPWLAILWFVRTGAVPALDGLRALGGGRRLVLLRAQTGALILLAAVLGASVDGALGASMGLAGALLLAVGLWWSGFAAATRPQPGEAPYAL